MTRDAGSFEAAVAAIAAAGEAPARWPEALGAIAAVTGDIGAILFFQQADGAFSAVVTPNLQAVLDDFSASEFSDSDFRFARAVERGFLESWRCVTDRDVATQEEIETHPYYGFLAQHGLKYFCGLNVSPSAGVAAALSVQRTGDRPPFSGEEVETIAGFGPPMTAALARNTRQAETASSAALRGPADDVGVPPDSATGVLLRRLAGED